MRRLFLLHYVLLSTTLAAALKIGIILREHEDKHIAVAFQTAVRWLNTRRTGNVTIERSSVQYLKTTKESEILINLCQLAESGVSFVVGPPDRHIGAVIEPLCEELHIVYIKYYWDVIQSPSDQVGFSVNVFPDRLYMDMTKELLLYWKWERVIFVYRQDTSIVRFHALLADPQLFNKIQIAIVRVEDDSNEAYLNAARRVRDFCDESGCWRTVNRVLLELNATDARRFLNAALQLGMINLRNWYFLTMLDLPKLDIEPFRYNLVRISATAVWWQKTAEAVIGADLMRQLFAETRQAWMENHANAVFTPATDVILTFDAVMLAASVHAKVVESQGAAAFETWASCNLDGRRKTSRPLSRGTALRDYIKHISVKGLSGTIEFNDYNKRLTAVFRIIELGVDGRLENTGNWSSHLRSALDMHDKELENTHSKVMIDQLTERPYVMKRLHWDTFEGNARYEGFCVDLLTKLSENLGFDFEIYVVSDGKYGGPIDETSGKWDGMIGELLNKEADMAVAPITVTARRLEVIDFTSPFLQLGISMLMRVPGPKHFDLMSFLYPLSSDVWIYMCLATICTTLVMVLIARVTPYEWTSMPEQSTPEIEIWHNHYSYMNTLWYLICVLLRASSGYNPKTSSTRVLSGVWWAFTLILIAQYTANFAAVLTVDRKSMPFNSLDELSNQTEYAFGSIVGGSTAQFFKDSHLSHFRGIWQKMESASPSVFVSSNKEGVQRVLQDNYVFLMESASMEYEVTQNCNLTQVGDVVLGSKGYSIALPKGSPWREPLSRQILNFNEKGIIMLMKNVWWKQKKRPSDDENGDGDCSGKGDTVNVYEFHSPLGFGQVAGLFLALTVGLGFAFCVAIGEYVFFAYKASKRSANLLSENRKQVDIVHVPPETTTTTTTTKPRGWSKLEDEQKQVRRAISLEQPVGGVLRASVRRKEIKV